MFPRLLIGSIIRIGVSKPRSFNFAKNKKSIGSPAIIVSPQNEKEVPHMLLPNYTAKILGVEDVIVKEVVENDTELHIHIEMPKREHICPRCSKRTNRVHDYKMQVKRDSPIRNKYTYIHLNKRRYACPDCGKRFYEDTPFVPKYHQVTHNVIQGVLKAMSEMRSMKEIGKEFNISGTSVARYFDVLSFGIPNLSQAIGIDEFRGNSGGEKFQCVLTNPKKKMLLDIMPSRNSTELGRYFLEFKDRNNVQIVVMDMSSLFRSVAKTYFPHAEIVADKYHVIRLVDFAFENVRKNEQNKFSRDYRREFKRSKSLLRKPWETLNDVQKEEVVTMLSISSRLARAYNLKESFRKIFNLSTRSEASKALGDWILMMEIENLDEFKSLSTTFREWNREILNIFDYGLTNAYTEGSNNKTKVLKRIAYGMRNFERFRKRRLYLEFAT